LGRHARSAGRGVVDVTDAGAAATRREEQQRERNAETYRLRRRAHPTTIPQSPYRSMRKRGTIRTCSRATPKCARPKRERRIKK
jgi:hypothetical protein